MGRTCDTLRWKSSCQVVLLAAAILNSAFLLTQAQEEIPVTAEPPQPSEGQDSHQRTEMLSKPTVSAFPSSYLVEFTDSITLTCEIRSGATKVRWFKNGRPLRKSDHISLSSDNRTLSIPSITRDDAGEYQCEVSNSASTRISDIQYVDVIYGPETPVIHTTEESSDLKLTCEADTFPDAHYAWFFNGRECGTGSPLVIQNATPEHSGSYVCLAWNVLTLQKRNSTLDVVVGAEVRDVTVTGPSVATEDQPVTLTCTAVGSSVSYSWFKGDQSLEPGHYTVLTNNNQNLMFSPSHRSDSGDYTCRGSNSFSSDVSEPHRLDILYGPDPPVIHEVFDRGRFKLKFSCRSDSYPAASYVWFLNEKFLSDQQNPLVRDLATENGGNYTCQAENRSTRQKRNTTLELEVQGRWM
ncbi:carcinoembryonic antigen-related cell adhesion molecule 5-like [Heteronotia binoei]|uniref:carcinoembryonic antigen-related cell adhesion molecule 5-like n=1 Tax=Heteronotia binoei TaxID=13085 RepID=UPI00292D3307|nr:carcinoembryonic antigen-related cell adhesion molecule 5-like [Heteronotia binoei]